MSAPPCPHCPPAAGLPGPACPRPAWAQQRHYKHYITRPTSGTPWTARCCRADTPGPHTSPPGTDNTISS